MRQTSPRLRLLLLEAEETELNGGERRCLCLCSANRWDRNKEGECEGLRAEENKGRRAAAIRRSASSAARQTRSGSSGGVEEETDAEPEERGAG